MDYYVPACSGKKIEVKKRQRVTVSACGVSECDTNSGKRAAVALSVV